MPPVTADTSPCPLLGEERDAVSVLLLSEEEPEEVLKA